MIKVVQRIYLSGPITGIADYHQRFEKAKVELVAAGYKIITVDLLSKSISLRLENLK